MADSSSSTFKQGDHAILTTGKLQGFEVVIVSIDDSASKATVLIAIFGGPSEVPFDVDISDLQPLGSK